MKRSKRLVVLLAVLAAAVAATIGLSFFQERAEQIKNSGETILAIDPDTVTALAWENDDGKLAFHREDMTWLWDEDSAFPVDQEKVADLLSRFESFGVAFVIEDVEDYGQYGLDDPVCTIDLTAGEESVQVLLGDYSQMDSKRYVSIGDGNVYLVNEDPLDDFDAVLSDMIDHDEMPDFEKVSSVRFSGRENYTIAYEEKSDASPCEDDVYFTQREGKTVPLDTSRVDEYLSSITALSAKDYVTYNATEEELQSFGMDEPELTVTVDYTHRDKSGEERADSFTLHVSRDPEEVEQEDAEEKITAYVRVGDSQIIYRITGDDYKKLMSAAYDDLRHKDLLTADFDAVTAIDISLEGETYTLTAQGEDDLWLYGAEEVDIADLRSDLEALAADTFTAEEPTDKLEIGLTVHLDNENFPGLEIELYRYDGESCLAKLDGKSVALVSRSDVVALMESIHAIVLGEKTGE